MQPSPLVRILRTAVEIIVALAALVPATVALLAEIGTDLAAIPATATSTQMRTALRTVGQKITDAIPT